MACACFKRSGYQGFGAHSQLLPNALVMAMASTCEILGAVKIKDGLFVGDELSAQDLEFVVSNKVTRVVNCAGRQVPNHWEPIGVCYLTYYWVDADSQIILDQRNVIANEIFQFVEEALQATESVLVHSVRGQSRSCCALAAYMMRKYSWGLRKTMEFLSSRRPDVDLKPAFLQQLSGYERRLMAQSKQPFSNDWHSADFSHLEDEDLLLRNTYLNSQMGPLAELRLEIGTMPTKSSKLVWADNGLDDKMKLEQSPGGDRRASMVAAIPRGILKPSKRVQENGFASSMVSAWPSTAAPTSMQACLASSGPPERPGGHVPTAWGEEEQEIFHGSRFPNSRVDSAGSLGTSYSSDLYRDLAPGFGSALQMPRGPRDSISSLSSSREPSPKASPANRYPQRGESSGYRDRGESPMRLIRAATPPVGASRTSPNTFGLSVGALRTKFAGPPAAGAGRGAGLSAFRTGGPVRAHADLLGDGLRKGRPATGSQGTFDVGTRPNGRPPSPGTGQRSSSNSRPPSPQARGYPSGPPGSGLFRDASPLPVAPGLGACVPDGPKQRSLASHMRRAPSPTPAFNRSNSPGKPRWRM